MPRRAELLQPNGARRTAWLWRWHRRAGVLACVLLLMLAVTGLALNHSQGLRLAERTVGWDWPYALYGPSAAGAWTGFAVGDAWLLQGGEGRLFLDTREVGRCDGRLVGALVLDAMILVACERELQLLTPDGQRIDALSATAGLAVPVSGLALHGRAALALAGGRWQRFDADAMGLAEVGDIGPQPLVPGAPPQALLHALGRASGWLHWERFLLDLHSGRLFGRAGVLLVDAGGVLSLVLALSGIVMWGVRQRRAQKPSSRAASAMSK